MSVTVSLTVVTLPCNLQLFIILDRMIGVLVQLPDLVYIVGKTVRNSYKRW